MPDPSLVYLILDMDIQHTFPRLSASAYGLSFEDAEQTFTTLREAGFVGIEGHERVSRDGSRDDFRILADLATEHQVPFTSYHLRFTQREDVAGFYETTRREAVSSIINDMENAAALGANTVILHPSTNHLETTIEGSDRYLDRLSSSLDTLVPVAKRLQLRIAVENMMTPGKARYFSTPQDIYSFRTRMDDAEVGFCLDTGHALISMGPERQLEILDAMGDRLIAFHLQDNARTKDVHIAPGKGFVDFRSTFSRIRALGIDEVMCVECVPFTPYYPFTASAWTDLVNDTRNLAAV